MREAVIITSALQRTSIPVLHSAAALLRLADMAYSGTTSFFIRVLLDKKYALPYRVVRLSLSLPLSLSLSLWDVVCADTAYSGTIFLFIRAVLDKKYALPHRVGGLFCHSGAV